MEHIRAETILNKGQSVQCVNEAGPLDGEICRRQAKGVPSRAPILQPTSGPETTPGAAGAPPLHLPLKFKMASLTTSMDRTYFPLAVFIHPFICL